MNGRAVATGFAVGAIGAVVAAWLFYKLDLRARVIREARANVFNGLRDAAVFPYVEAVSTVIADEVARTLEAQLP